MDERWRPVYVEGVNVAGTVAADKGSTSNAKNGSQADDSCFRRAFDPVSTRQLPMK